MTNKSGFLCIITALILGAFTGCQKKTVPVIVGAGPLAQQVKDPILTGIYAFGVEIRQAYNSSLFDELESKAAELRASKALFDNGTWKISKFYSAFDCSSNEPESMWQLHDHIHQAWITAKPASITAKVAYAKFLTGYAWQARGSGYADTVTEKGWQLFEERLSSARTLLEEARSLPEKDPMWWRAAMTVALGQGWPRADFDTLVRDAKNEEPGFWEYDTTRAYYLLPRWYGKEGEWEAYTRQAAKNPAGLGAELYARTVLNLSGYYDNIFKETEASWPRTREGLAQLRQKYPKSLEFLNATALMASMAGDRELAKATFAMIGNTYESSVWNGDANLFLHYKQWSETGR